MEGTAFVCRVEAKILFYPRSTHSFLSPMFAKLIDVPVSELEFILTITTPVGKKIVCSAYCPSCTVKIGDVTFPANLILLDMHDFDVILGMDWLSRHHATMDYFDKTISFKLDGASPKVEFHEEKRVSQASVISALSAVKILRSGCEGFIAFITEDKQSQGVEDIPVVCEFSDVFPKEIPGLPLVREVEFTIELMPGTAPISIASYRMALAELGELKLQLQELLKKGFIRPSISSWGAPMLFVKKKDGSLVCV